MNARMNERNHLTASLYDPRLVATRGKLLTDRRAVDLLNPSIAPDLLELFLIEWSSLAVQIEKPLPLADIVKRLELEAFEPAEIIDEAGELLGAVYPERGVLLGYLPRSKPPKQKVAIFAANNQPQS